MLNEAAEPCRRSCSSSRPSPPGPAGRSAPRRRRPDRDRGHTHTDERQAVVLVRDLLRRLEQAHAAVLLELDAVPAMPLDASAPQRIVAGSSKYTRGHRGCWYTHTSPTWLSCILYVIQVALPPPPRSRLFICAGRVSVAYKSLNLRFPEFRERQHQQSLHI